MLVAKGRPRRWPSGVRSRLRHPRAPRRSGPLSTGCRGARRGVLGEVGPPRPPQAALSVTERDWGRPRNTNGSVPSNYPVQGRPATASGPSPPREQAAFLTNSSSTGLQKPRTGPRSGWHCRESRAPGAPGEGQTALADLQTQVMKITLT